MNNETTQPRDRKLRPGYLNFVITSRSEAILLLALGLIWWLLFVLFTIEQPVSTDAKDADTLLFFILGPFPVLLGLHLTFKVYRERFSWLYASAIVLALSPLLMFFFLVFLR